MEYKRLGLTDLNISRVGYGCWAMGGFGWGQVDDRDSIAAVHRALDLGINFFDTADVYGFGHSEEILCKALGEQRSQVVIATKFGVKWDNNTTTRDCSPERVVQALEGSLRRLQLDCIPLYQIHWPDLKTPIASTMEALKKCQESGKIRYIGCSNFSVDNLRAAQNTHRLESLQVPYNIVERQIEEELLACCQEFKMGVIVYSPLAKGLFTGKYKRDGVKFEKNDIRLREENFQRDKFDANLKLVEKLKEVGTRYGKTPAQVAIRWILDNSSITCAITGVKKPEQIEDNSGALGWRLSEEDRDILSGL